ncbi:hypothetical protein H6F43_13860 [Leptolyngbya sp. FACHB-36]|uniref:hypothetical protein n=1 Tax=Leptolyngbya sp. FACHB-36 TaxID=2692808 RepID=UPI001680B16F|nr:hypothetical protein [Leptolyngbya sp. FACHB-36]MBD2021261.1 hypothetical protein [Leptolyngbya sp. FACHB-36]
MSAHTFDSSSHSCPVCQRGSAATPQRLITGLLACPHCRERLVVSWSGHYVRDPFTLKPLVTGQTLRRESRPLARIRRDLRLSSYSLAIGLVGGAVFLGVMVGLLQNSMTPASTEPPSIESLNESRDK